MKAVLAILFFIPVMSWVSIFCISIPLYSFDLIEIDVLGNIASFLPLVVLSTAISIGFILKE